MLTLFDFFLDVSTSAGRGRFPWSVVVWRGPGCFMRSVGVTWSLVATKKPETMAPNQLLRLMKLQMRNGRSMQMFWWHNQNVIIFPVFLIIIIIYFFLHIYKITNSDSQFPSVSVKLGNFKSCVSHFERALTKAKLQEDESAMNAIQKVPTLPRLLFVPFKDVCHP